MTARQTDEWYIARVGAMEWGSAPVVAKRYGVPVTTVHRWVKEARCRGLIPSVDEVYRATHCLACGNRVKPC